ncbi:lipopolysaccharide biosynthesis protein [Ferrimonas balearica]|uniref:lipopolysaccharide biosynthesis protein n=1 Tax=Ferrimonas balearica TaxID=44012 RepID=UPI001C97A2B1|nr:oligosaccharide flippase family protein [Ferrimonas balearica]MBY5978952.1 oligosaccharide flippase family protein [Ferrimonas balearica]
MSPKTIMAFALGPIGTAVLGFFTLPLISWYFDQQDIGRIAIFQTAISFCAMLLTLGLDQAYVREYHEADNKLSLFNACLLPSLLATILFLLAVSVSGTSISQLLFEIDSLRFSVMVAGVVIASILIRYLSLILRMEERGLAFSMSRLLPKLIFLLVIGYYILFTQVNSFEQLMYAHFISYVVVLAVFAWNTRKSWCHAFTAKVEKDKLRGLFKLGLPLTFGAVAYWGLTSLDKVFLRTYSSYEELALYSVSVSFAGAAAIVQNVFSTIWAPTVYKWIAQGTGEAQVEKVTRAMLGIVVGLFALIGLFSWMVNLILPQEYDAVRYLLVVCMSAPLLYTLSETTKVGIGISRRSSFSMAASLLACGANVLGNYLLVPKYGAAGAAASTSVSFWLFLVLRTEFSCYLWKSIKRAHIYLLTAIPVSISLFNLFVPETYDLAFMAAWLVLLLSVCGLWRQDLKQATQYLSSTFRRRVQANKAS